jgi:hypothetical protein
MEGIMTRMVAWEEEDIKIQQGIINSLDSNMEGNNTQTHNIIPTTTIKDIHMKKEQEEEEKKKRKKPSQKTNQRNLTFPILIFLRCYAIKDISWRLESALKVRILQENGNVTAVSRFPPLLLVGVVNLAVMMFVSFVFLNLKNPISIFLPLVSLLL